MIGFMKKYSVLLLTLVCVLCACTDGRDVDGIHVSQEMIDIGDMNDLNYCRLYKNALDGDTAGIRTFVLIDSFDGAGIYVHGVYLIRLIDRIGDDFFVKTLADSNKEQKIWIETYIKAGMDIYEWYPTGNGAVKYESVKDYWNKHPKIKKFIMDESEE